MELTKGEAYVLGLDYGSDSCRAVLIDASDGSEAGVAVMNYPRWTKGLYCNPQINQFRQHPQDYIDVLEGTVKAAVSQAAKSPGFSAEKIKGIAIDTTGSTPCAIDAEGTPLALKPAFAENPGAMFVLWKDHTAVEEAGKINHELQSWGGINFAKFEGGIYSAEWFWSKILRVFKEDKNIAEAAASFIEHCDWMTSLLTGNKSLAGIRRGRCAMGHKAMWHREFADSPDKSGGYPSADFLAGLDPRLVKIRESLGTETYTSDTCAGGLSAEWAAKLGIPAGIPVAVGAYDAHMGAVGGGVKTGALVRVMGTSTCDVIVGPKSAGPEKAVRGICGQVDGSVVPGMIGYEAGQSAFGDVYAWFKQVLMWPIEVLLPRIEGADDALKEKIAAEVSKKIIPELEKAGARLDPSDSGIIALDWLNGRRTPDADQLLKGAVAGLTLGSDAVRIYRALAEATAFGARAIVERFREEGVAIEEIIGIGGVARKSPFVMQILADVLNMPINVNANDQSVALGAAMFAAVAAGLYQDIPSAQKAIGSPIEKTYAPDPGRAAVYEKLYQRYRALGVFIGQGTV
ncbi:MAG: ribulokinase [Treponema sp.]|jgi:L-ribulokinase|nr:ribulokinase [Treponema sp.]